jgi:hypothetical protein
MLEPIDSEENQTISRTVQSQTLNGFWLRIIIFIVDLYSSPTKTTCFRLIPIDATINAPFDTKNNTPAPISIHNEACRNRPKEYTPIDPTSTKNPSCYVLYVISNKPYPALCLDIPDARF